MCRKVMAKRIDGMHVSKKKDGLSPRLIWLSPLLGTFCNLNKNINKKTKNAHISLECSVIPQKISQLPDSRTIALGPSC
jgi:hypothetical protein